MIYAPRNPPTPKTNSDVAKMTENADGGARSLQMMRVKMLLAAIHRADTNELIIITAYLGTKMSVKMAAQLSRVNSANQSWLVKCFPVRTPLDKRPMKQPTDAE